MVSQDKEEAEKNIYNDTNYKKSTEPWITVFYEKYMKQ